MLHAQANAQPRLNAKEPQMPLLDLLHICGATIDFAEERGDPSQGYIPHALRVRDPRRAGIAVVPRIA
jgi:hypothetical protein